MTKLKTLLLMKYLKLIALYTVFNTYAFGQVLDSEKTHYFDKYIEGVFKTIENPPVKCVNFLDELVQSKRIEDSVLKPCFSWIEKEIPKQIKFDILSYRPEEKLRAEAIKNQAIFGTCYLKDPDSKYYDTSYAELDLKLNKSTEEKSYIDNINSHCNKLHLKQIETDYILKEIRNEKSKKERTTMSVVGPLVGTLTVISAVVLTVYFISFILYFS